MSVRNEIMADDFNALVEAFKFANPKLTHDISQEKNENTERIWIIIIIIIIIIVIITIF